MVGEFVVGALLALLAPILVAYHSGRRSRLSPNQVAIFMGIGALGWILAKIPKAIVVLPLMKARGIDLTASPAVIERALAEDLWFALIAAAAAGVFEEITKPVGLLFRKDGQVTTSPFLAGWIVGLGAGLIEAVNSILGAAIIGFGPGGALASAVAAPWERIGVIAFHGALTSLVVGGYVQRRFLLIGAAILVHAAVDYVVPQAQLRGMLPGTFAVAGVMAVIGALTVFSAWATSRRPARLA